MLIQSLYNRLEQKTGRLFLLDRIEYDCKHQLRSPLTNVAGASSLLILMYSFSAESEQSTTKLTLAGIIFFIVYGYKFFTPPSISMYFRQLCENIIFKTNSKTFKCFIQSLFWF
jgi:hypothetical protein